MHEAGDPFAVHAHNPKAGPSKREDLSATMSLPIHMIHVQFQDIELELTCFEHPVQPFSSTICLACPGESILSSIYDVMVLITGQNLAESIWLGQLVSSLQVFSKEI